MPKKPAAPEPESCGSCRYFLSNKEDEYGFCRRGPPSVFPDPEDGSPIVLWRIVATPEWCGEFSRKLDS